MKTKIQNMKRVCIVHLSISTILSFTHGSKTHKPKLGYLSLLDDLPSSSRLGPNSVILRVQRYDLDARAQESPCESFQTPLFEAITN